MARSVLSFGHYTDYLDEKLETDIANQVQKTEKEKWSRSVKIRNA